MSKDEKIIKYIELRYILCKSRKGIKEYLEKKGKRKKFKKKIDFYIDETDITSDDILSIENQYPGEIDKAKRIERLYNSKKGFNNNTSISEFLDWYKMQGDKCYYCGIQESILTYLFTQNILKSKRPKRGKYLEVDRKNR